MAFLDHIRICNQHELGGYCRFHAAGRPVGWVRHRLAATLIRRFADRFAWTADGFALRPPVDDFDGRTAAMAEVADALVGDGVLPKLRHENYPVLAGWGTPALLAIDRAVVPCFGIAAFGLHVNGFVRDRSHRTDGHGVRDALDGMRMWVGRRSLDRGVAPGKLDNLIAGGLPLGLTVQENLIKEAAEEAGMSAELAVRARPVGAITYLMENKVGLKPDTLFVYDLDLPADFVPRNMDGEVAEFMCWPLAKVAAAVRDTDEFKFNCNLVVIDFLLRHGWFLPDDPTYLELVSGLHR